MLDTLLNVGSAFDWITPLWAFIQDFFSGPVADFGIPARTGWSRDDIRRYLNTYGIRVWGLMYDLRGEVLMFTVNHKDADFVNYLMSGSTPPLPPAPLEEMYIYVETPTIEESFSYPIEAGFDEYEYQAGEYFQDDPNTY
jgi:hypothetical protein